MDNNSSKGRSQGLVQNCEFIKRCPMFPQFQSRRILRIFQVSYCESDFVSCARYKLAKKSTMPPPDLLPDGTKLSGAGQSGAEQSGAGLKGTGDTGT